MLRVFFCRFPSRFFRRFFTAQAHWHLNNQAHCVEGACSIESHLKPWHELAALQNTRTF